MRGLISALVAPLLLLLAGPVWAAGNFASLPVTLDPLKMNGRDLSFSVKEYHLETGKYYKWQIESDGEEEFTIQAPELFRNSWIYMLQLFVAPCSATRCDVEIQPAGSIHAVQFDEPGAIYIYFVPLHPGEYDFYAVGFQSRGMIGKFVVR